MSLRPGTNGLRVLKITPVLLLLALFGPLRPAHGCTDYDSRIRWLWGDNFAWYIPGYGGGNYAFDVAWASNTAFLAHHEGFLAYDLSNPQHPVVVGTIPLYAERVAAAGNRAFALASNQLTVVDTSIPSSMHVLTSVTLTDPQDLAVLASYAYVADGNAGLAVVSLGGIPSVVGRLTGIGTATRVAAMAGWVYVGGPNGLWVVNVSSPGQPAVAGHLLPSASLTDLAVGGDGYLYVGDAAAGLRVFDLADPGAPVLTGTLPLSGVGQIAASAHHVLIGEAGGIGHVDATVPSSPQLTGAFRGPGLLGGQLNGLILYAAVGWDGFQTFDFSHPTNPPDSAFLADGASGRDLTLNGTLLSLVTGTQFETFDVSDPLAPHRIGGYPLTGGDALAVDGSRAYVLSQTGLTILDLSSPAAPALLGTFVTYGDVVAAKGNRAYVTSHHGFNVDVLDVSDPAHVVRLSQPVLGPLLVGLAAASETEVYTVGIFEGLSIVDRWNWTNPASPVSMAEAYEEGPADGLGLQAGRLVTGGIFVTEYDPATLARIGRVGIHAFGGTLAIGSSRAYCSDGAGCSVFDLDPMRYAGTAFASIPTQAGGVAEVEGHLYLTDGTGLHVFAPPCAPGGLSGEAAASPRSAFLSARPDPFRGGTNLQFRLEAPADVALSIWDAGGREIRTLLPRGTAAAGAHLLAWDGRDQSGREVPAGVYFGRLLVNGERHAARMVCVQ